MPKSLVTGGAGFIGSHVAQHLLNLGHEVILLDDLSGGDQSNLPQGAHFVEGSITDVALVSQLFSAYEFTYVYHLAAYAAEGLSHFIRSFNYQNNLAGSIHLINESIKHSVKCFVFTSSIAVYGSSTLPMIESAAPQPEDPYGIAKYAVEMDLKCAHDLFGLDYIIFRPHNVYGEHQNIGDRYRNVIGIFMNQILQKQPLTIYGNGAQTRAFSYIDDVAPYIALSTEIPTAYNQIFNIGSSQPYSVNDLAKATIEAMQQGGVIHHIEARNEVQHAYADHTKIHQLLGINSDNETNLSIGLAKMAEWVIANGARTTPKFKNIEILQNLPPIWLAD